MSSIEPDCSGGEIDGGEEIPGGFVVARGDGAELFEFAEEIFDQGARLVEFLVERARRGSVPLGRDDGGFSGARQGPDDPLIGIEGLVGDQDIGGHLRQQGIGAGEIVNLSRGQQKAQRVAEGIDQGMDLGAQSAPAAADRLIFIFFWVRRRCVGEPARWCCRSSPIRGRRRPPNAPTLAAISPSLPSG